MGTYSERCFHQGILEQNVELFQGYNVPDTDKIEDFRKAIEDLPGQDNPELFGLHSNAENWAPPGFARLCVVWLCVEVL